MAAKKTKAKASAPSKTSPVKAAKAAPPATKKAPAKPAASAKAASAKVVAPAASSAGLGEGSKAPAFSLPDETGTLVSSASLAGKPYVIYFYPKDDTPGCTKQACDFRDNLASLTAAGYAVVGISPDTVDSHCKFRDKHGIEITLAADPEHEAIEAFGVWAEKSMYGRKYMGVERSTFLIGPDGRVARAWRQVKVPGHVEEVLSAAEAL